MNLSLWWRLIIVSLGNLISLRLWLVVILRLLIPRWWRLKQLLRLLIPNGRCLLHIILQGLFLLHRRRLFSIYRFLLLHLLWLLCLLLILRCCRRCLFVLLLFSRWSLLDLILQVRNGCVAFFGLNHNSLLLQKISYNILQVFDPDFMLLNFVAGDVTESIVGEEFSLRQDGVMLDGLGVFFKMSQEKRCRPVVFLWRFKFSLILPLHSFFIVNFWYMPWYLSEVLKIVRIDFGIDAF